MTFVADGLIGRIRLMLRVIAMGPAGPGRGRTSAGAEMALVAVFGQVMALGAVDIAFTVITRKLRIQPGLAQWVIDPLTVAIMAGGRAHVILPHDGVTLVADLFLSTQPGMRGAAMLPVCAWGRGLPAGPEMTNRAASADIRLPLGINRPL